MWLRLKPFPGINALRTQRCTKDLPKEQLKRPAVIPHIHNFSKTNQLKASKNKEDHSVTFLGEQRNTSWYVAIRNCNDCGCLLAGAQIKEKVEMQLLKKNQIFWVEGLIH